MAKAIEKLSFEEALAELEDIVKNLESGEIELEKAIDLHTRGSELSKHCASKLEAAKLKVDKIIHADGKAVGLEESSLKSFYEE